MLDDLSSTIAQMLFVDPLQINFARLVGDLDVALSRLLGENRVLTWDCEDVAMFDLPGTRVLLALSEAPRSGLAGCLTLAIGPAPQTCLAAHIPNHANLCSRLVERVQGRLHAAAILWHDCAGVVTPDLIDALTEALPSMPGTLDTEDPIHIERPATQPLAAANDHSAQTRDPELARLRAALYPTVDQITRPAAQMCLTARTQDATLVMVWLQQDAEFTSFAIPSHAISAPLPRAPLNVATDAAMDQPWATLIAL